MYHIYCILNRANGHVYIGQTKDQKLRIYRHRKALDEGRHDNQHLMRAWAKYGSQEFEFFMLADFPTREECSDAERFYIDWYTRQGLAYNLQSGGHVDFSHLEETKEKIREARAKQVMRPMSEETKDKIRAKKILRDAAAAALKPAPVVTEKAPYQHSEETKAKIAAKLAGNNNGSGKPCSEEKRQKISASNIGKPKPKWTEEQKRNQSEQRKGVPKGPMSDETKEKLRQAALAQPRHPVSEETRAKISEAQKRAYENGRKKGSGRPKKPYCTSA